MCDKNKPNDQMVDDRIALAKLSYVRTKVEIVLEGAGNPIECWFCLLREGSNQGPSSWSAKLVVLDYDLQHGRGQDVVRRALTRLRLPNMHELAKMWLYDDARGAEYRESFVDVYAKDFVKGHDCSCVFEVNIDEKDALELIEILQKSDIPEEVEVVELGSFDDDRRHKLERQLKIKARMADEESIEAIRMREFSGLEDLQLVITEGQIGTLEDGAYCRCFWTRDHGMWMLVVMVYDYDVEHGDGQEIVEEVLAECGLLGISGLSEVADTKLFTPFYGENIYDDDFELVDEKQLACHFEVWVEQKVFEEQLRDMMTGPRGDKLGFAYTVPDPEETNWIKPFELTF